MVVEHHHILIPSKVTTLQLGIPQPYKKKCIEEAYKIGDVQSKTTNVQGIMSSYEVWKDTDVFNLLLDKILHNVTKTFPIQGQEGIVHILKNAWSAIYQQGHYTIPHIHEPAYLSFVYYLQSDSSTPLIFDDCNLAISPPSDMLVIFPGSLRHSVPKHLKNEDRIVIAGNLELAWENTINTRYNTHYYNFAR